MSVLAREVVLLYVAAALLAVFAATSELVGRFRDQPFAVVRRTPGLFYLALNAALAAVVLAALRYASPPGAGQDLVALEQVLLAGFGARILVRTKVTTVKGKDGATEDVGPGAVFEQFLASLSRAADRGRAAERLKVVDDLLAGFVWEKVHTLFVAEMAGAMQDLTTQEKSEVQASVQVMANQQGLDDATRVNLMGYLVLNYGGESFLKRLAEVYRRRYPVEPAKPIAPAPAMPAAAASAPASPGD